MKTQAFKQEPEYKSAINKTYVVQQQDTSKAAADNIGHNKKEN